MFCYLKDKMGIATKSAGDRVLGEGIYPPLDRKIFEFLTLDAFSEHF